MSLLGVLKPTVRAKGSSEKRSPEARRKSLGSEAFLESLARAIAGKDNAAWCMKGESEQSLHTQVHYS